LTEAGDFIITEDGDYLSEPCEIENVWIWPAIERPLHSFRMPGRPTLRVTEHEWMQSAALTVGASAFPADAALRPAIEQLGHSFASRKRWDTIPAGETRFDLGIIGTGGFPLPAELWPGIEPETERTPARPNAIPRGQFDIDWISENTPPTPYDPAVKMPWMYPVDLPRRRAVPTAVFMAGVQDGWNVGGKRKRKMTASGTMGQSKYMGGYGVAPHPFGV